MTRFEANEYTSLDEVLQDVDTAASTILDTLQLPNGAARNQFRPLPMHETELIMKVTSFKQQAHELVRRETIAAEKRALGANGQTNYASLAINGSLGSGAFTQINANADDSKMVLTLYGNAPGPKQLFSSLQIPTKVSGEERDILQTIREAGLPNGITTTKIVPIKSTSLTDDKKHVPTLGELFPTPSNVPALLPPKPSKIATTRSSTVGWYQPAAGEPLPRTASYFKQSISTGHWLDYSNASASQGTKRKQRERALSLGGAKAPQVDAEPAETEAAKLDALFRSAYSSFAPTKDDTAAIAPSGLLDRIWWQQIGEKSFERLVDNINNLDDVIDPQLVTNDATEDVDEIKKFEELVQEMEKDPIDQSLVPIQAEEVEKSAEEKDVEEILEGISELLETLNSYQRIRHMSLNSASRPAGLLSAPDTTSLGTPSKPSEPEQATYEILKSQLTLMIASLPPFAVAKLDPDRLADLSISTKIEVQLTDHKGVMEEDEAAARAKVAALSAASNSRAAPTASLHRSNSSSLYGNQYAPSRSSPAVAHQYYGSTQTPVRPPSNPMQRPPNTAPVPYQAQRPAAAAPYRTTSYGTPTYPHQAPRPAQQPYAPSGQQQYLHTPSNPAYMRPPGQNYQHIPQSAPQAPMNGRYPGQPAYPHQAQPSPNAMNYAYGQSANINIARQASPQKPLYSPQPSSTQPRPSYSTSTPSNPQDRRPYIQNAIAQTPIMNGSVTQTPQPFSHQSSGLTNYSTFMTAEQQESMVGRQRAQLAAQQAQLAAQQANAQQQARSAAQAAMGSPSKTQVNGGNPVVAGL
jgi:hypothetical protein